MNVSISQLVSSQAYEQQATARSKANIFWATAVALYVMIFQNTGLGLWWVLIIPGLWFVASIVFALPFMLIVVWLATIRARAQAPRAKIISLIQAVVDLSNYAVLGVATYYGIHWLAGR